MHESEYLSDISEGEMEALILIVHLIVPTFFAPINLRPSLAISCLTAFRGQTTVQIIREICVSV